MEGNLENNQALSNLKGKVIQVPLVDDTLTKAGYAADAKVVGQALGSLTGMYEQMALDVASIEEPADRGEFRYVGSLPENTDLNNLLATGSYSSTSSVAKTVSNTPIADGAFHIHVFKAATPEANETSARPTIQILTATSTTDSRLFWRKHSTGTWGEWKLCEDIRDVKPRGNYSGNGSTTSRTIPVKGEGQVVLIYGGVGAVFVTPYGGFAINSSGVASFLPVAQIYKGNDGIVLTTDNALVNKNGNTYGYQLL
jgi:hypothetical protein